tara:strand:+ start:1356 stop:2378 length:1023 start_codon:yes stop_codon:yes gene_type:complete
MRCSRSRFPGRQRGAALIVALLVFAVCAALVVAMRGEFQRYFQRNANLLLAEQVNAYLRGAEQLATVALLVDRDRDKTAERPRDDLTEIWAQPAQPYALDNGGWMQGSLEDLQGRFNLNALAQQAQEGPGEIRFSPEQKQFIRLLQALDDLELSEYEAILITHAVGDWIDADRRVSPNGAEDDYYAALSPAYRTANRPMASVSELRAVANVTPEVYQALAPWVTVWPADPAPLNIHTAPATVLRSINAKENLSPLSEDEAIALVEYRRETGFVDKRDFLENPVFQGKGDMEEVAGLLGERSAYFLLRAEAEVADRNMRLYSVLERRNRAVTALARASGSL